MEGWHNVLECPISGFYIKLLRLPLARSTVHRSVTGLSAENYRRQDACTRFPHDFHLADPGFSRRTIMFDPVERSSRAWRKCVANRKNRSSSSNARRSKQDRGRAFDHWVIFHSPRHPRENEFSDTKHGVVVDDVESCFKLTEAKSEVWWIFRNLLSPLHRYFWFFYQFWVRRSLHSERLFIVV